jgi:hypothetical protein
MKSYYVIFNCTKKVSAKVVEAVSKRFAIRKAITRLAQDAFCKKPCNGCKQKVLVRLAKEF